MRAISKILGTFTVCLLVLALLPLAAGGPKSYSMVCKGGGDIKAEFSHVKRGSFHGSSLSITFKKSGSAASSAEPAPGHCAWVDRPLRAEEPSRLVYAPGPGQDFGFIFEGNRWRPGVTEDESLEQLLKAILRPEKFFVRCHRENGWFKIDGVGP